LPSLAEAKREITGLTTDLDLATTSYRKYESVVFTALALSRRLGLPDDMRSAASEMTRQIAILRSLEIAYRAVQIARMSAGDPLAWAGAISSVGMVIGDVLMEMQAH
jgi:hypothetical protein